MSAASGMSQESHVLNAENPVDILVDAVIMITAHKTLQYEREKLWKNTK